MLTLPYIIAGIIGLSGAILLVVSLLDYLAARKKQPDKPVEDPFARPPKEVMEAHQKAERMLEKATEQADAILTQGKLLKDELVTDLDRELHQAAQQTLAAFMVQTKQFERQFTTMFQTLQEEYQKKSHETLTVIEEVVQTELADFRDILKRETFSSQQIISEKIQEEFMSVQKEIITYRENKYKEVDQIVSESIKRITEEALGRSLTEKDHEKLIIESLEKAKSNGMFTQ